MPNPLHPAVVHFPIVLALLLPLVAAAALVAIFRGVTPRAWLAVVAFGGLLALSSWAATETGEEQEDAVEAVVAESAIHDHEEAAEALLVTSGLLFLLLAGGLMPGRVGRAARIVATPASLVLVVLAFRVGGSGGALVYEHGAAAAYVSGSAAGAGSPRGERSEREREEGRERGRH